MIYTTQQHTHNECTLVYNQWTRLRCVPAVHSLFFFVKVEHAFFMLLVIIFYLQQRSENDYINHSYLFFSFFFFFVWLFILVLFLIQFAFWPRGLYWFHFEWCVTMKHLIFMYFFFISSIILHSLFRSVRLHIIPWKWLQWLWK